MWRERERELVFSIDIYGFEILTYISKFIYFSLIVGKHVINLFVQYTPYKLLEGSWEDPTLRVSLICFCKIMFMGL